MKYVVVNADDLGICESTNDAIAAAHRRGIVTSASLMANGSAFDHAVETVVRANPNLGVGIHVCLTSGRSVLPKGDVPLLVDDRGCFRHEFLSLLLATKRRPKALVDQIEAELEAQFARIRQAGIVIDHVDGHRHVHMLPAIYSVVTRLSLQYDCTTVRLAHEPLGSLARYVGPQRLVTVVRNILKRQLLAKLARAARSQRVDHIRSADWYYGVLDSGHMDTRALGAITSSLQEGVSEIATHPGSAGPGPGDEWNDGDRRFVGSRSRRIEFEALVDPSLRSRLERRGITLVSFRHLASGPKPKSTATISHVPRFHAAELPTPARRM